MGITKSFIMPLLTTLAALIIIVHCIEEDLENEYRRDLRPRIADIRKPTYDESWRARDATAIIPRPRRTDDWKEGLPDEPLKHRRPGRKRKRRPQTAIVEQIVQQEETEPNEPPRPYHDVDSEIKIETTERPKIRRRKPDQRPIQWVDEDVTAVERPFRRRLGSRRNRPSLQAVPEINGFHQIADIIQEVEDDKTEPQDKDLLGSNQAVNPNPEIYENKPERNDEKKAPVDGDVNFEEISRPQISEDKSVSEFSMEVMKTSKPRFKFPRRYKSASPSALEIHDIEQEPKDPLTLKDILKRSNGSSLSEILQQHNLSLNDLLHGKEQAVSIFKNQEFTEDQRQNTFNISNNISNKNSIDIKTDIKNESEDRIETKHPTESVTDYWITTEALEAENENIMKIQENERESTTATNLVESTTPIRRRFPLGQRKKLRMRPTINVSTTQKGQLSRDLVALNARKYTYLKRYTTKSKEWKDIVPNIKQNDEQDINNNQTEYEITTVPIMSEDTTILIECENKTSSLEQSQMQSNINKLSDIDVDLSETTTIVTDITTEIAKSITTVPIGVVNMARPTAISLGLRQTALNNRLKRKRLKQKTSTTESPQDNILKNLYGKGNLVSSSEFIAKTQPPGTTAGDSKILTTLVDFITTDSIKTTTDEPIRLETISTTTIMTPKSIAKTSTEESAKTEIEEILNDTETLSKLSRILMERNMTLEELVALRERGSSRIHLADVFHNSSKEPNPPEPFLTKSVLEPMSKETYPLRALLDANSHDSNGKTTTIDPMLSKDVDVPIIMDFGNNVNENAENMGIMSLFNNYTKNITLTKTTVTPDGSTNKNIIDIEPNITSSNETIREGKVLNEIEDDVVNWNDVLSLMGRLNETEEMPPESPFKKIILEDIDEDGLIVLEDLQRLRDLDSHIHRGESPLNGNIEVHTYDDLALQPQEKGLLDNVTSQTTSVTIVTASIIGLAMILFLLTYIAFKWQQQKSSRKKHSFCEERISTPVFETRKGHKNNSSIRSISPMIQTSNIYVNTLDSHIGDESGEYIWDSMRQPYQ